jgi:fatty acid kinase fatty acid binding subunit
MAVRIVTDSTADISLETAGQLGVSIVPVYVRFGEEVYRDLYDINQDEFYEKLASSPSHPSTSQPSPADFSEVYRKLAVDGDEIVSIHLTAKLSGTYNAALQGKEISGVNSPIEVVDTGAFSMGLGLAVMAASRVAAAGGSAVRVLEEIRRVIGGLHVFGILDTLKYLHRGGRIGTVKLMMGAMLNVKPLIKLKDGELVPMGLARTRAGGIERLMRFTRSFLGIEELALVYSYDAGEAYNLRDRLASFIEPERMHIARLGPGLGVHGGPGTLLFAFTEKVGGAGVELRKSLRSRLHLPLLKR